METKYPCWVKVSLLGSRKRQAVKNWAIVPLLLFTFNFADIIYIYYTEKRWDEISIKWSIAFLAIFLFYHFSIRWVDKHGDWDNIKLRGLKAEKH